MCSRFARPHAEAALKGAAESAFRFVANLTSDRGDGQGGCGQPAPGKLQS
jgi:hypothetical protein